jgi:hypothetical protein
VGVGGWRWRQWFSLFAAPGPIRHRGEGEMSIEFFLFETMSIEFLPFEMMSIEFLLFEMMSIGFIHGCKLDAFYPMFRDIIGYISFQTNLGLTTQSQLPAPLTSHFSEMCLS